MPVNEPDAWEPLDTCSGEVAEPASESERRCPDGRHSEEPESLPLVIEESARSVRRLFHDTNPVDVVLTHEVRLYDQNAQGKRQRRRRSPFLPLRPTQVRWSRRMSRSGMGNLFK